MNHALLFLAVSLFFTQSTGFGFQNIIFSNYMINKIKNKTVDFLDATGVHTKCTQDLKTLVQDLFKGKFWALQMIDASGKLNSGILNGNIYQLGNYDECIAIEKILENDTETIQGQYCTVLLTPSERNKLVNDFVLQSDVDKIFRKLGGCLHRNTQPHQKLIKFAYGICIPKSCSLENLRTIWKYFESVGNLSVHAAFEDMLCDYKGKEMPNTKYDTHIFMFFAIVLIIVALSTIYDVFFKHTGSENDLLAMMSLYNNTKLFLSTKSEEGFLSCCSGIKALSMLWILAGHRMLINALSPSTNHYYVVGWSQSWTNPLFVAANFCVDTFFGLSGIFVVYASLKFLSKGHFSTIGFYVLRMIRLTPPLIAVELFYIGIMKYISNGPLWYITMKHTSEQCSKAWWRPLLQITNFGSVQEQCIPQTWYLSVDSQLYFFAPIILLNIGKRPKQTIFGVILITLASMKYTYSLSLKNKFGPTLFPFDARYFHYIYIFTIARLPAWTVGVIFGYLVYTLKNRNFKIPRFLNVFLLATSVATLLAIILVHKILLKGDLDFTSSAVFNAAARPIWTIAVCYIVLSCSLGHGGLINKFLSLKVFLILGKLTYCMYLVHFIVYIIQVGQMRAARYFNWTTNFHDACGDLVIVLLGSTALHLVFESPILETLRILNKRRMAALVHKGKAKKEEKEEKEDYDNQNQSYVTWVFSLIVTRKKSKKA